MPTLCNKCGGIMVPAPDAIVPALGCIKCKRLIPATAVKAVKGNKASLNRVLRSARRQAAKRERMRNESRSTGS